MSLVKSQRPRTAKMEAKLATTVCPATRSCAGDRLEMLLWLVTL